MFKQNEFKRGIHDGIPIFLGYISVSFAFGIYAVTSGLTELETLLISMTTVTSAGQLASVPLITAGSSLIELAATQLIINMRYALMSVSLSQKLDSSVTIKDRFLIAFVNTDEVFAVALGNKSVGKKYMYGLILMPYIGWCLGTLIGVVAGNILPSIVISALGIAIYAMLIAIIIPQAKKSRKTALCILFAVSMSFAFRYIHFLSNISSGTAIIICAVTASLLFAWLLPVSEEEYNDG